MKQYKWIKKNKKGFSLIELMIVIAIIGILGVSAFAGYTNYINKSVATKAGAEVATVEIAVNQYNSDHPTSQITDSGTLIKYLQTTLVTGGYLQKQPEFLNNEKYGCKYDMVQESSNGTYHVTLSNCAFNKGATISLY